MKKIKIINGLPYHFLLKHPGPAYVAGWLKQELDSSEFKITAADYTLDWLRFFINKDPINKKIEQKKRGTLIDKANEYLDNLANIDFLKDFERLYDSKKGLENLIEEINKVKIDERLEFTGNTFRYWGKKGFSYKKRSSVLIGTEQSNREDTMFYSFLDELSDKLISEKQDVIGFSISDNYQLIPTLTLARLIKEKEGKKKPKIVLGGDFITRRKEVFKQDDELNKKLYEFVDVVYYGGAEATFSKVVKRLAEDNDPSDIIGVITKNYLWPIESEKQLYALGKRMEAEMKSVQTKLGDIPAPKFSGLYESAITPTPVPAVHSQRSCPEKCGFCGIGYNWTYGLMKQEKFAKDIETVINELGTKKISITDLTLYPAVYRKTFKALREKGIKIEWDMYPQFDEQFEDEAFVKQLSEDGCRLMQFGLESVSERTLKKMSKAKSSKMQGKILENVFNARIWPMIFYITGYPSSTVLDDLAVLPFLEEYGQYSLAIKPNVFKLSRGSPEAIKYQEDKLGIKPLKDKERILQIEDTGELDTNLYYTYTNKQSKKVSEAILRIVERWVKQKHGIEIGYVLDNFDKSKFSKDELKILKQYKEQKAPLNEVARTYVYPQRYFLDFEDPYIIAAKQFAKKIKKYDGTKDEVVKKFWNDHNRENSEISHYGQKISEEKDLRTIYNAIIGPELLKAHQKYQSGNRNHKFTQYYDQLKEKNKAGGILLKEFKDGLKDLDDVIKMCYSMKQEKMM